MKILVCVKQVPDTETKIKIQADGSAIDTAGIKWVLNPYDEFAVEEAIKTKEANAGTTVTVMGLGPKKRVTDSLRTALAMGADDAIAIDCDAVVDSLATAKALAKAAEQEGPFDLIFCGKLAIDDNQAAVAQMVAEFLKMPHATVVSKFTDAGETIAVERDIEGGAKEISEMKKPAMVAANKGLNMPRYASLPGIMKAKKKPLKDISIGDLGVSIDTLHTRFTGFRLPPEKPAVKMLEGDAAQQTAELTKLLREESKVL